MKAWIDDGVKWQDGFTFKKPAYEPPLKPRNVALPAASGSRTNPLDRILDAYLAQHGKPSSAVAATPSSQHVSAAPPPQENLAD